MNHGNIDNPSTLEARLFAFLLDHVGTEFSCGDLSPHLDHTPCAHSYVASLRVQLRDRPDRGYMLTDKRWDKTKGRRGAYVYKLVKVEQRPVASAGQMSLLDVAI